MKGFQTKEFNRVNVWGKIIGVLIVLQSVYMFMEGLFYNVIGALPGVAAFILGMHVFVIGNEAQEIIRTKGRSKRPIYNMVRYISFTITFIGILMIITISLYVVLFLIVYFVD